MPFNWARGKSRECRSRYHMSVLNPRRSCVPDPLVHHGRHFGRTIHTMTNVQVLLTNGIIHMGELADQPEEAFTAQFVV
jgi:hypothetical protein